MSTTTRRIDGKPESIADKRFFDLRESGFTGPIDQDDHADSDPTVLAIFAALQTITVRSCPPLSCPPLDSPPGGAGPRAVGISAGVDSP